MGDYNKNGWRAAPFTRFIFPRSSIKVILYVVGACAALLSLVLLALSAADRSSEYS